jgi:hypothetical protein
VEAGFDGEIDDEALRALRAVAGLERKPGGVTLHTSQPATVVAALVRALDSAGSTLSSIAIHQPTLEDLYLELTGKETLP